MTYKLKIRKTKPFELFNNLEKDDLAELGVFLKTVEIPKKKGKEIVAEHLWVKIDRTVFESNEIYRGELTEEPKYLKQMHRGDTIAFSPENVLNARSRKAHKKVRSIKDFVCSGFGKDQAVYKQVLTDGKYCYAVDPDQLILRTKSIIDDAVSIEKMSSTERRRFDQQMVRFDRIELDKFHVRLDIDFIKRSMPKIRAKSNLQASMVESPLIRISDRTFLSFHQVSKLLLLLKTVLVYIHVHEQLPQLYFKSDFYDGFICLGKQNSDSIIVDAIRTN